MTIGPLTGSRLGGSALAGAAVHGRALGAADVVDTGESIRFTMPAATWDVTDAAFRAGNGGSSYFGAFIAIVGDGIDDHAWYTTHDGFGWNPQAYNAALAGFTMHAVNLAAGNRTAAQVATALRSAIDAEALYDTVGGSSGNVDVTGDIDADACFTGSASPGTSSTWGDHNDTTSFDSNPVNNALQAYSLFTDGPGLVFGMGARLNTAGDNIAMALFTGGTAASGGSGEVNPEPDWNGTTRFCSSPVVTGSGTGWVWTPLTPAQVAELADNTPVQHMLKGNTSSTHGSFRLTGDMGTSDLAAQQLAVVGTGDIDPTATVAWPSSLSAIDFLDSSFSVVMHTAFAYKQRPHRGDAGGIVVSVL